MIHAACLAKKNVIIVRQSQLALESPRTIHLWWDDLSRSNSELMVLLSYMLTAHKAYKKTEVHLNSIVSNESGRQQRLKYFHDFFAQGRFAFVPHIYIKEQDLTAAEIMKEVSAHADLVLIGMRPPDLGEDLREWAAYYDKMTRATHGIAHAVFVLCPEAIGIPMESAY